MARDSSRGVRDAGWGRTLFAGIVAFIYFFPVLWIIVTAFKTYNDAMAVPAKFLFALLLTGVETRTVPVAMAQTIGGDIGVRWGLLAAIETLFLVPVAVVTFVLQHHLLRGVTFGTIKR